MPRRLRPVSLLPVLLCCAAAVAASGRPSIRTVSMGYTLAVRANRWAPAVVLIDNPGPATRVAVTAVCELEGRTDASVVTRAEIDLPAQACILRVVYVRIETSREVRFDLHRGGNRIDTVKATINPMSPREFCVLGLSYRNDQNFVCDQPKVPEEETFRFIFKNIALTTPSRLSSRWEGYASANAIILGTFPPSGLTSLQERALVNWVRSGGVLVLCPGGEPSGYAGTVIEEISPVVELGTRLIEKLPALKPLYGSAPGREEKGRIGLTEAYVVDGETELSMGEFPLIVSRDEGMGRVIFVAFDIGNERLGAWNGMLRLYQDLLLDRGAPPLPSATPLPELSASYNNAQVGARVLPRSALTVFLGVDVALVAVLLLVMRRRREWAFVILLIAAPVLAVVMRGVGAASSGVVEPSVSGVVVAESASGSRRAFCSGYYTSVSPKEARVSVLYPDRPTAFPDAWLNRLTGSVGLAAAESQRQTFTFVDGDIKRLDDVAVRERSSLSFQGAALAEMPGTVDAAAVFSAEGVRLKVTNRSKQALSEGFVTYNRNTGAMPDLAPGQTAEVELDSGTAQPVVARYARGGVRSELQAIAASLYGARRINDLADTGAVYQGWLEGAPLDLDIRGIGKLKRKRKTLWAVRASVRAEGKRILVPKGVASRRFESKMNSLYRDGDWVKFSGHIAFNARFGLPSALRGLKATRIELYLDFTRAPGYAAIEVYNHVNGAWDCILGKPRGPGGETARPSHALGSSASDALPVRPGRTSWTLRGPESYLHPRTGEVRVRYVVASEPEVAPASASRAGRKRPVISDLDIEIEGVRP